MSEPEVKRIAGTYEYIWHDLGVSIGFRSVREGHGELNCEVFVSTNDAARGGHVVWTTLNMSVASTRTKLALSCHTRTGRGTAEQWVQMFELCCLETAEAFRHGEPFADLADVDAPSGVSYLARPILPEGEVAMIAADGNSAKGWIGLGIALSLALGWPVIPGILTTKRCPTLYLDWETSYLENVRRQSMLCRGLGINSRPHGMFYGHMLRPLAAEVKRVSEMVEKNKIELVIIDSAVPATGGNPNDADVVAAFIAAMRLIPSTKLVLAHVSKATAQGVGPERARVLGSVMYENLARSIWEGRADAEGNPIEIGLFHRKANMEQMNKPFGLRLFFDDVEHSATFGTLDIASSPFLSEHATLGQRIVMAVRGGAISNSTLAEMLGVKEDVIRTTANRELEKGNIRRVPTEPVQGKGSGFGGFWGPVLKSPNGKVVDGEEREDSE